jgi:hypothetical protein
MSTIIMNNFDVNNVEKVCRACLSEENEMMSMMDSELKEMFIFCTSLEVNKLEVRSMLFIFTNTF